MEQKKEVELEKKIQEVEGSKSEEANVHAIIRKSRSSRADESPHPHCESLIGLNLREWPPLSRALLCTLCVVSPLNSVLFWSLDSHVARLPQLDPERTIG